MIRFHQPLNYFTHCVTHGIMLTLYYTERKEQSCSRGKLPFPIADPDKDEGREWGAERILSGEVDGWDMFNIMPNRACHTE